MKCVPLPPEVRSKIRSGFIISTVAQCVEELIMNSIDAEASRIVISLNFEEFKVKVEDNGNGLGYEDLKVVGIRHSTSKCVSLSDLSKSLFYGFRGEALNSIIAVSDKVSISTKLRGKKYNLTRNYKNGISKYEKEQMAKYSVSEEYKENGLIVSIRGLLSKCPVRQNGINILSEIERIEKICSMLTLINPHVTIELFDEKNLTKVIYQGTDSFLNAFEVCTKIDRNDLVETYYSHNIYFFKSIISKKPCSNKKNQFIFVNRRYISRCSIHKQLGQILITTLNMNPLKISKGQQENYPAFALDIRIPYDEVDLIIEPNKTQVNFKNNDLIKGLEGLCEKFKADSEIKIKNSLEKLSVSDRKGAEPSGNDCPAKVYDEIGIYDLKNVLYSKTVSRIKNPEENSNTKEIPLKVEILPGINISQSKYFNSDPSLTKLSSSSSKTSIEPPTKKQKIAYKGKRRIMRLKDIKGKKKDNYISPKNNFDLRGLKDDDLFNITENVISRKIEPVNLKESITKNIKSLLFKNDLFKNNFDKKTGTFNTNLVFKDIHKLNHRNGDNLDLVTIKKPMNFSKEDLKQIKIIGQFDRKFIVSQLPKNDKTLIILFDQHAVHERIILEKIISENFNGQTFISCTTGERWPGVQLNFHDQDMRYINLYYSHFQRCGLDYTILPGNLFIQVTQIPKLINDKVLGELPNLREKALKGLLYELFYQLIQYLKTTNGAMWDIPKSLFSIMCSMACRSAIKFGDLLLAETSNLLINQLSTCSLPFQCAHGRPSIFPLLELPQLPKDQDYNKEYLNSALNRSSVPLILDCDPSTSPYFEKSVYF